MKRKESATESAAERLPEYGQQKLKLCADSYRNIARVMMNFPPIDDSPAEGSRTDVLYRKRLNENQNFMARQFLMLADQLSRLAQESYSYIYAGNAKYRELARLLKAEGILVKHIYFMEDENRDGVVEITMCSREGRIPAKDVAAM
ncbi:MAG: hypothetical protein LUH19_05665, partial [Lachnospiraceae bacterium]|nr:hypothetical protein [Lachnospiraceae bacterium]